MRKLMVAVLVLAVLYSGYWFIGAQAVEGGLRGWLDARASEGWVAEYADVSTRGYPNRFDTTLTDIDLVDPETGVAWTAPFFQILALSYKPNHIIAVWPNEQTIASPYEKLQVTSEQMRGSVVFKPGTSLTLDRSTFVLDDFRLASSAGWTADVAEGRFATRQTDGKDLHHDVGFQASAVRPADTLRNWLDPAGLLPQVVETLRVDATLGFDAPWDRFAIERARPALTAVDLKELKARWGRMDLRAAGELTVDARGVPEGRITVRAENWRQMLDVLQSAGLLPENLAPMAASLLGALARASGSEDTLDAPLTFKGGRVAFGPIPLGQAPLLKLR